MKNKNKIQENSYDAFEGLTKQDCIDLLGVMCLCCAPTVVAGNLIKRVWSEYIPQNADDAEIARQLFMRNGIDLKLRHVKTSGWAKHPMLRSRAFFNLDTPALTKNVSFMHHVEKQTQELVKKENRDKWWELQSRLETIRQEHYQR